MKIARSIIQSCLHQIYKISVSYNQPVPKNTRKESSNFDFHIHVLICPLTRLEAQKCVLKKTCCISLITNHFNNHKIFEKKKNRLNRDLNSFVALKWTFSIDFKASTSFQNCHGQWGRAQGSGSRSRWFKPVRFSCYLLFPPHCVSVLFGNSRSCHREWRIKICQNLYHNRCTKRRRKPSDIK